MNKSAEYQVSKDNEIEEENPSSAVTKGGIGGIYFFHSFEGRNGSGKKDCFHPVGRIIRGDQISKRNVLYFQKFKNPDMKPVEDIDVMGIIRDYII